MGQVGKNENKEVIKLQRIICSKGKEIAVESKPKKKMEEGKEQINTVEKVCKNIKQKGREKERFLPLIRRRKTKL